jgi:hypothetical protein
MFKYNVGDLVYYLVDNKVHSARITSRNYYEQYGLEPNIYYTTIHDSFSEDRIFSNVDELLVDLKEKAPNLE